MKNTKIMNALTEKDQKDYAAGADAVIEAETKKEKEFFAKQEAEKQKKINSGAYIEVDGKLYDAKYYKA